MSSGLRDAISILPKEDLDRLMQGATAEECAGALSDFAIKLQAENEALKAVQDAYLTSYAELQAENEALKAELIRAYDNASFFRCCALSGEVFKDGAEPYPKLEGGMSDE